MLRSVQKPSGVIVQGTLVLGICSALAFGTWWFWGAKKGVNYIFSVSSTDCILKLARLPFQHLVQAYYRSNMSIIYVK